MENVIFKCYSDNNKDSIFICASLIRKITHISSNYCTKLIVEYYDDEFCVNCNYVCDYIEPMQNI